VEEGGEAKDTAEPVADGIVVPLMNALRHGIGAVEAAENRQEIFHSFATDPAPCSSV